MPRPTHNLSDMRFGALVAMHRLEQPGRSKWRCLCDCGSIHVAFAENLMSGHTTSCGCQRVKVSRKRMLKHGLINTPAYQTWRGIKQRTENPNCPEYKWYGARGIFMAEEWRTSFEAFLEHVGQPPSKAYSLDRINNDKGYEPGNVRWATKIEQQRNTSANRLISYKGLTCSLAEWADRTGLSTHTIGARIDRLGWDIDRALTTPLRGSCAETLGIDLGESA